MTLALAVLGLLAGVLTTLAGQGGGLLLLLSVSALLGPRTALAITAPALLLGNVHRAVLFWRSLDRPIALRVAVGAVPGSFIGGLLAGAMPELALKLLMVALTALAIARALGWLKFDVPKSALTPAGLVVGSMTGASGGAGILFAPVLLATGLRGRAYVATLSTIAFATHAGRVVAYASNGFFTRQLALPIVVLVLAIFAGNAIGEKIRVRLSERVTTRLEYGVLLVCVAVSLAGMG